MNFRKVTDLESLTSLPDGATVLVIDGGEAKQIPAAKVGGGSATILYGVIGDGSGTNISISTTTSSYSAMYMDAARTVAATAQDIYDAVMGGCHWISVNNDGEELVAIKTFYGSGVNGDQSDPTNITFVYLTDVNNIICEIGSYSGGDK